MTFSLSIVLCYCARAGNGALSNFLTKLNVVEEEEKHTDQNEEGCWVHNVNIVLVVRTMRVLFVAREI